MINIVILILIIIALLIYAIGSCYLLISISRSMNKISEKEHDTVNCILDILYQEWRCKYGTRR